MKRSWILAGIGMSVLAGSGVAAQENKPGVFPPGEVDQVKVDQAIEKGVAYLKTGLDGHMKMSAGNHPNSRCELVLYTFANSGVPENDPAFKTLFEDMMKRKLEATYCVALQAMILEEIERVKYQRRIQMCAQFLVDNQNSEGQWGYGTPSIYVEDIPTETPRNEVRSGGGKPVTFDKLPPAGMRVKPTVKNKLKVEKKRDGEGHDNSNTQYAALGLRACHDAGILLPSAVVDKAIDWWRKTQKEEKGAALEIVDAGVFGPNKPKGGSSVTSTLRKAEPNGWCYGSHGDHPAYGSMSAGAVGSLCILKYVKDNDEGKKKSWKDDKDILEGMAWLDKNFSVAYNPGFHEHAKKENSDHAYYYFLYGLERAGMLYGTEWFGKNKWYPEGVKVLLAAQKADGSWDGVVDTCFAILFLKRATKSLDVATQPVR